MLINFLPNSDFLLIPGTKGSNLIEHVTNYKILRVFIARENRQHLVASQNAVCFLRLEFLQTVISSGIAKSNANVIHFL